MTETCLARTYSETANHTRDCHWTVRYTIGLHPAIAEPADVAVPVAGTLRGQAHLVFPDAVGDLQQSAHARERAQQRDGDEAIGVASDRVQQELVPGEVALAEVEFDLRCMRVA